MAEQSANTKDGVSGTPLKGQTNDFDKGNNPSGMGGLKQARNTGEMKQGTAFLRSKQGGVDNGMKSE